MPDVSVVIPTYQRAHLVGQAIQSVLDQTYRVFEIVVVNDGSTDDTADVLAQFGTKISVVHQENRGLSAARNAGIRASERQYVALLDDDDVWLPEKLEMQIRFLESRPEMGLVYSDMEFFDDEGPVPETYRQRYPPFLVQTAATLFFYNYIPASTVVLRRACFDEVGLFDETLTACEDYDMWLRVIEKRRVDGLDQALARYRLGGERIQSDAERMLVNLARVKEKAFQRNDSLRSIPKKQLDRFFYSIYLRLARLYLDRSQTKEALAVLERYRQARGTTPAYDELWSASTRIQAASAQRRRRHRRQGSRP